CKPAVSLLIEPRPFCRTIMRNRAAGRLADQTRIFGERAGPVPRRPRLPFLPPLGEFTVVDQQTHAAPTGIDPDTVAFTHQRQRPADEGFRRDIADAHAARGPGKPPVGDERNLLAHALSINQRGDTEHLAHPRTADRTFVADDEDVAGGIFAIADGIDAVFLVFEYAGRALEHQVLDTGHLDDRPVGAKIALENRDAAVRHDGRACGENDLAVG